MPPPVMMPISWMPLKSVKPMAKKAPGGREAPGENAQAGVDHGQFQRLACCVLPLPQFLFVARDQMHAEVDRQADQHRQERDRQNIQMSDRQRGVSPSCSPDPTIRQIVALIGRPVSR